MCDARLDSYSMSTGQALQSPFLSPYAIRHFQAVGQTGNLGGKVVHVLVGLLEAIPLLGLLISLFEAAIVHMCKCQLTPHEIQQRNNLNNYIQILNNIDTGVPVNVESVLERNVSAIRQAQTSFITSNSQDQVSTAISNQSQSSTSPLSAPFSVLASSVQNGIMTHTYDFYQVDPSKQRAVRETTNRCVFERKQPRVNDLLRQTVLYRSPDSSESDKNSKNLLGRFDVLQITARMDYDGHWDPISRDEDHKRFFIHQAAALNIGETRSHLPADFAEYSTNGQLDLGRYIQGMGIVFKNILTAEKMSGATDIVWIPFGMGAFLRYIGEHDRHLRAPEQLQELRNQIANEFVHQFSDPQFDMLKLHLCLPRDIPNQNSFEAGNNLTAFTQAFSAAENRVKARTVFEINADATHIAQTLANNLGEGKVSLCNAANRQLIGNHWFRDGALRAVDENIHRRSSEAAQQARLLNGLKSSQSSHIRRAGELAFRVQRASGNLITLSSSQNENPSLSSDNDELQEVPQETQIVNPFPRNPAQYLERRAALETANDEHLLDDEKGPVDETGYWSPGIILEEDE